MLLNEYQNKARATAIYLDNPKTLKVLYPTLGLCGETGEVAEKIKKALRDKDGIFDKEAIKKELGDICWYIANLAADLDLTLEDVAQTNLDKLNSRKERGVLQGNGDNR